MAQVRRIGIEAQMVDPAIRPARAERSDSTRASAGARAATCAWTNYAEPLQRVRASAAILATSVFITVVATIITLLINSMAAFALVEIPVPRPRRRCSS